MTGVDKDLQFGVPVHTQLAVPIFRRVSAIASAHSTSVGAVVAECVRRALSTPPTAEPAKKSTPRRLWTDDDTRVLVELHAAGKSDMAIGDHLGFSSPTVGTRRNALGLAPNFRGRPKKVQP